MTSVSVSRLDGAQNESEAMSTHGFFATASGVRLGSEQDNCSVPAVGINIEGFAGGQPTVGDVWQLPRGSDKVRRSPC